MILALVLASGAIDAERAFAHAAQVEGQWTAFRRFAANDAVMFAPLPVRAQDFLKDRRDPPTALIWWPADSFIACDGGAAVNTGPWMGPRGESFGYFTTVWLRQSDGGWKWSMDGGDDLAAPRPAGDAPKIHRAACTGRPATIAPVRYRDGDTGEGQSADRTLAWRWHVASDGSRRFDAWLWDGHAMRLVKADRIAAP